MGHVPLSAEELVLLTESADLGLVLGRQEMRNKSLTSAPLLSLDEEDHWGGDQMPLLKGGNIAECDVQERDQLLAPGGWERMGEGCWLAIGCKVTYCPALNSIGLCSAFAAG